MFDCNQSVVSERLYDARMSMISNEPPQQISDTEEVKVKSPSSFIFYLNEVLVGIGICFAQIPASIAFAFIAHLDPSIALHSAWIVGFISSAFGGRPAMISGATGAFAVVITTFIPKPKPGEDSGDGYETIFITILFAGMWICLFVMLDLIKYGYLISDSVMMGFCNGLAIIIAHGQVDFFDHVSGTDLIWSMGMVVLSALIMEFIPRAKCKYAKYIPSSLMAISVCILMEYFIIRPQGARTKSIADLTPFSRSKSYPDLFFMRYKDISYDLADVGDAAYRGFLLAMVASIECLMTLELVNKMTDTQGDRPQTVKALAVANLVSGLFGGMGGNPMVEFSTINCMNGGRGKTSGCVAAISILLVLVCGYEVLNYIPLPSLVGIMAIVCIHTFHWHSLTMIYEAAMPSRFHEYLQIAKKPNIVLDVVVILTVSVLTVITNLVIATLVGIAIDCIGFSWDNRKDLHIESTNYGDVKVYNIVGGLFFASKWELFSHFDVVNDPDVVEISFTQGKLYDFTALETINELGSKYERAGKKLVIDHLSPFARALRKVHAQEKFTVGRAMSVSRYSTGIRKRSAASSPGVDRLLDDSNQEPRSC